MHLMVSSNMTISNGIAAYAKTTCSLLLIVHGACFVV